MSHVKNLQEHIKEMRDIQDMFQEYFDEIPNEDNNVEKIMQELRKQNILQDHQKIVSFLRFISISTNHYHRHPTFFNKITEFLFKIKDQIQKQLTNFEIFMIFKKNKILLLYLFEEKIIIPDEEISKIITFQKYQDKSYPQFFWPEFKSYFSKYRNDKISKEFEEKIIDNKYFEQRRKIGQNDHLICQLIRDDSISDFISYINRSNIPLTGEITNSIFETNPLFYKNRPTLIEYALFYGSIQIVIYLIQNGVKLTSIDYLYAIHSNNPEIIGLFETKKIEPPLFESKQNILKESIKCYHNKITQYIIENYYGEKETEKLNDIILKSIKYYNYSFYPEDFNKMNLFSLIELKNATLCEIYFNENNIDINETIKEKIEIDDFVPIQSGYPELKEIDKTALIKCIEVNNSDFFQFLISRKNLNLDLNNKNPLFYAIQQRNPEIVYLLLTLKDINVNIQSINKFKKKILKFVEYINRDSSYNVNGEKTRTPLIYALEKNSLEIAKLLLSRKEININYLCKCKYDENFIYKIFHKYEFTKSVLFLAVESNDVELVSMLLSHSNININYESTFNSEDFKNRNNTYPIRKKNSYKKTALSLAVENENYEIVKLLLSNENVDVNYLCYFKYDTDYEHPIIEERTPLAIAVAKKNIKIINLLLSNEKIDVNIITNYFKKYKDIFQYKRKPDYEKIKETAFSIAIQNEDIEIIKLLLQKNINMSIFSECENFEKSGYSSTSTINTSKTYLEIAIEKGNLEIFNLLLENNNIDVNLCSSYCRLIKNNLETEVIKYKEHLIDGENTKTIIIKKTFNALRKCIESNMIVMLKILLERKDIDINAKILNSEGENTAEKNALLLAVDCNDIEIVKLLLERKDIDVNLLLFRKKNDEIVNKHTVLNIAVKKKNDEIIQLLSNKEAVDVNIDESQ